MLLQQPHPALHQALRFGRGRRQTGLHELLGLDEERILGLGKALDVRRVGMFTPPRNPGAALLLVNLPCA
jgi:hypothetical protein